MFMYAHLHYVRLVILYSDIQLDPRPIVAVQDKPKTYNQFILQAKL